MNEYSVIRISHIIIASIILFEMAYCSVVELANLNREKANEHRLEGILKYECPMKPIFMDTRDNSKCRKRCRANKAFLHSRLNRLICFKVIVPAQVYKMRRQRSTGDFECECGLVSEKARRSNHKDLKTNCDQKPYRIRTLRKWFQNSCTIACGYVAIFVLRIFQQSTLVWCHDSLDISNYKIVDLNGLIIGQALKLEKRYNKYVNRTRYLCKCGLTEVDVITPSVNLPQPLGEGNEGVWLPPTELDLISKVRGKKSKKLGKNRGPSYKGPPDLTLATNNHAESSSRSVKKSHVDATLNQIGEAPGILSNQKIYHQGKTNQTSSKNIGDFLSLNLSNYTEKRRDDFDPNFDLERPEESLYLITKRDQKDDFLQSKSKKLKEDQNTSKPSFIFDKSQKSSTRNAPVVGKPRPRIMIKEDEEGERFNLEKNLQGNKQLRIESGKGTAFKDPIPKMKNSNGDLDIENLRIS